jgi:Integral membrane protein TerC family
LASNGCIPLARCRPRIQQATPIHDLTALAQVAMIDGALAGDNAVVVGLPVAGLPPGQKRPAIILGIAGPTAIRIALGAIALELLAVIGLLPAGALLLLGVCWRTWRELRRHHPRTATGALHKTLPQALLQIVLADLAMSFQRARGRRRGLWQPMGAGHRIGAVRHPHGRRRQSALERTGAIALACVGGAADRPLRCGPNDLGGRHAGVRRDDRLTTFIMRCTPRLVRRCDYVPPVVRPSRTNSDR